MMKKLSRVLLAFALMISLTVGLATIVQASEKTVEPPKVMWGKTELKIGQIGKVSIIKETLLYRINSDGSLSELRKLSKGDEFRVYSYQAKNGGLYGVGGGGFVKKNKKEVIYETPSKTKLRELARINGGSTASLSKPTEQVAGIKTLYGNHTYGSKSQAEYDAVVKKAKKAFSGYKEDTELTSYIDRYISGERAKGGFGYDSQMLELVHNSYGDLLSRGVSKAEVLKLIKSANADSVIRDGSKDPRNGKPRSAYDAIILKIDDCDSTAESQSLVFDMVGYSTMIVAGNNHADLHVKIGGNWYFYGSGSFKQENKSPLTPVVGTYIMSQPTF